MSKRLNQKAIDRVQLLTSSRVHGCPHVFREDENVSPVIVGQFPSRSKLWFCPNMDGTFDVDLTVFDLQPSSVLSPLAYRPQKALSSQRHPQSQGSGANLGAKV